MGRMLPDVFTPTERQVLAAAVVESATDERRILVGSCHSDFCPGDPKSDIQPASLTARKRTFVNVIQTALTAIRPSTRNGEMWDKAAIHRGLAERRVQPRAAVHERPDRDREP